MSESQIIDRLRKAGVKTTTPHTSHAAWRSFVRVMKDREYGPSAVLDAWLWFASGWDAEDGTS